VMSNCWMICCALVRCCWSRCRWTRRRVRSRGDRGGSFWGRPSLEMACCSPRTGEFELKTWTNEVDSTSSSMIVVSRLSTAPEHCAVTQMVLGCVLYSPINCVDDFDGKAVSSTRVIGSWVTTIDRLVCGVRLLRGIAEAVWLLVWYRVVFSRSSPLFAVEFKCQPDQIGTSLNRNYTY
jgi:hypothetical protein